MEWCVCGGAASWEAGADACFPLSRRTGSSDSCTSWTSSSFGLSRRFTRGPLVRRPAPSSAGTKAHLRAARTICQIFAFVNEHSTTSNPRIENIKAVRLCGLKYLMVNMLICAAFILPSPCFTIDRLRIADAAPPPEVMAQVKPYSVAYFGYHGIVGLCILGVLGFFIEFVIRLIGCVSRDSSEAIVLTIDLCSQSRLRNRDEPNVPVGLARPTVLEHLPDNVTAGTRTELRTSGSSGLAVSALVIPRWTEER